MHSSNIVFAIQHKIWHDGLKMLVSDCAQFSVQDSACNTEEILSMSYEDIDVLLLDLDIPTLRGSEIITELLNSYPDLQVLAIGEMRDSIQLKKVIKAGASDTFLSIAVLQN